MCTKQANAHLCLGGVWRHNFATDRVMTVLSTLPSADFLTATKPVWYFTY